MTEAIVTLLGLLMIFSIYSAITDELAARAKCKAQGMVVVQYQGYACARVEDLK